MADAPIEPTPALDADALRSRRQLLLTGTVGVAASAFLSACTHARKRKSSHIKGGQSGLPVQTTLVAPTVPPLAPTADQLAEDVTLLRTGSSLELLAAQIYSTFGPDLTDATWKTAAVRFAADHTASAAIFTAATTPASKQITKANEYMQTTFVDPVAADLHDAGDAAILDFFRSLESTLVATYVSAAGTFTTPEWRAKVMTIGDASARRVGVLSAAGDGQVASAGLYPVTDLISNNAYLPSEKPKKAAG